MAASVQKVAYSESNAAKALDMTVRDFKQGVEDGYLPRPVEIMPGQLRWPAAKILAIVDGSAMDDDEFEI